MIAPPGFGSFGKDLLVGNFGNGWINAFDSNTGAFWGTLEGANGQPIVISGLWSLSTRTGSGFDANALYLTAGIDNQPDGLWEGWTPRRRSPYLSDRPRHNRIRVPLAARAGWVK